MASGMIDVVASLNHACAITPFKGVACWGDNARGQLGIEGVQNEGVTIPVRGLPSGIDVVDLSVNYGCALSGAGIIKCWGENWGFEEGFSVLNGQSAMLDTAGPSILY